jgi:hypothetical protein
MRAIDQALAGSCQGGANPFRLGKDSPWFVGLPEAINQRRSGIHPTALQGDKMGESASCRAGVVRARPSTIQRSSADGVAGYSLFAIRNNGGELRETNVGAGVLELRIQQFEF